MRPLWLFCGRAGFFMAGLAAPASPRGPLYDDAVQVLLPVLRGRESIGPFEITNEVAPILHADDAHYLLDAEERGLKKFLRLPHPQQFEVLLEGQTRGVFEQVAEARG